MAGIHQEVNFNDLVPNHNEEDIIVWGAQECPRNEKEA